jgi:hypothetical protein
MLDIAMQDYIFSFIPSTLTYNGASFSIQKSLGTTPLNEVDLPSVNLTFNNNNSLYYRSIDEGFSFENNVIKGEDIRSVMLRYRVGATDATKTISTNIVYRSGISVYDVMGPAISINSITSGQTTYTSTDYELNSDRKSITWTGSNHPANNVSFIVNYSCIVPGYVIASAIMEYLVKYALSNLQQTLAAINLCIDSVEDVMDISKIYEQQALTVLAVDMVITYPFSWTYTLPPEEEAVPMEEIIIHDLGIPVYSEYL